MTYSANAIANYFLDLAKKDGKGISPLKLQKLLYYAYGWWWGYEGEPLFDEHIQAWSYGPVVPSIYREFRQYGNDDIESRARSGFSDEDDELPKDAKEGEVGDFLREIWRAYGKYSATKLTNMTHVQDSPWSVVFDEYEGNIPPHTAIPDAEIEKHFKLRAERAMAKARAREAE